MNRIIIMRILTTIASNIDFYFNFLFLENIKKITFGQSKNILYSNKLWAKCTNGTDINK